MRTYQMMEHVSAFSREKGASLRAQTLSQVCTMPLAPSLQRGCQYVLGTLNCKGKDLGRRLVNLSLIPRPQEGVVQGALWGLTVGRAHLFSIW